MAEPMPASELDAIRARRDAAAEGPYEPEWDSCDCDDPAHCRLGHRWIQALRLPEPHTRNHEGEAAPWEFLYSAIGEFTPETVLFFAAARQDVGALLAEVKRLRDVEYDRDRFQFALEEINAHRAGRDPSWRDAAPIARAALDASRPSTTEEGER